MSAAAMIQKGVDRDRDAILAVLEDPPEGLAELRVFWRGISATAARPNTAASAMRDRMRSCCLKPDLGG
jgi:hypothetical protein